MAKTLPELARKYGVTLKQANYACDKAGVQPTQRIGIIRLFDEQAEHRFVDALRDTGALPAPEPGKQLVGAP